MGYEYPISSPFGSEIVPYRDVILFSFYRDNSNQRNLINNIFKFLIYAAELVR